MSTTAADFIQLDQMAVPNVPDSVFDLIEGGTDFVFDGWPSALARCPLFRVVGVRAVLRDAKVAQGNLHCNTDFLDQTRDLIPHQWFAEFQPTNKTTAWSELGRPQLPKAIAQQFQVFDSAVLSVLYIANFMDKWGYAVPKDYFDQVRIVPITYSIGGLTEEFYASRLKGTDVLTQLQRAVYASDKRDVADVALRQCGFVSRRNADVLCRMLTSSFPDDEFILQRHVKRPHRKSVYEDIDLRQRSELAKSTVVRR
jgi:hypothetical protein